MALGEGCDGARGLGTRDRQVEELSGLQGEPKNCRQTSAQPHIEWMEGLLEVSGRPGGADFGEARAEHLVHSADGEAALVVVDSAMGGDGIGAPPKKKAVQASWGRLCLPHGENQRAPAAAAALERSRVDDGVVGADLEGDDAIHLIAMGGHVDHWHRAQGVVVLEAAADLDA